jgi:antitoxin YefM
MVNQQKINNSFKSRHSVILSDEGWKGVLNVANGLDISVSELLEKIGLGELAVLDNDNLEPDPPKEIVYVINGSNAFEKICDEVVSTGEPVTVTRPGGDRLSVIPTAELNSIIETLHLFKSPKNGARLLAAIERAEQQIIESKTIEELCQEVGIGEEE